MKNNPPEAQAGFRAKHLLRLREVMARCGYRKAMVYRLIRQQRFPNSVRLGPNSVAWDADDIDSWINERITQSKKGAP